MDLSRAVLRPGEEDAAPIKRSASEFEARCRGMRRQGFARKPADGGAGLGSKTAPLSKGWALRKEAMAVSWLILTFCASPLVVFAPSCVHRMPI